MFKPLNGRVLIFPDKEEKTVSGIIVPDTAREKKLTGVIIVGGELVKKGDRVLFPEFGYDKVKLKGKEYYIVAQNTLLGILDSDD